MKGAKKHFSRALTLLLSVLIMLQTVTVPAFAAENTTENVEVATNDASTEEESTFNLITPMFRSMMNMATRQIIYRRYRSPIWNKLAKKHL